jgi:hypothetical protein
MLQKFTKEDFYHNVIATYELRDKADERMKKGDSVIGFAYTDYGGDFFDKVCIEYFAENHPENFVWEHAGWNGKNGILFGDIVDRFIEDTKDYLLGFDDIESKFYQLENDTESEAFTYFLAELQNDYEFDGEKCYNWLMENKSGYYTVMASGLDYDHDELLNCLIEEKLIVKIED